MNSATPQTDPLAGLRDIQLPEPVSAWPPAPGWWLLAALLLALSIWLSIKLFRAYRAKRADRAQQQWLMAEIDQIEQQAQQAPQSALNRLSQLLRRSALRMQATSFQAERPVAGLHGEDWWEWLQAHGGEVLSEHREWLLEAPYQAAPAKPPQQLFDDCRRFFKHSAAAMSASSEVRGD